MDEMRQSVGNAAWLSVAISVIMTVGSMVGMRALLTLMHTPEDIFQDSYTYIMIICGGIFAQVLYNILASILRALGNSKTPLYFLILAALLNVALDLLFISRSSMGDDHCTGSFRTVMSGIYHKMCAGTETEKRGLEIPSSDCKK